MIWRRSLCQKRDLVVPVRFAGAGGFCFRHQGKARRLRGCTLRWRNRSSTNHCPRPVLVRALGDISYCWLSAAADILPSRDMANEVRLPTEVGAAIRTRRVEKGLTQAALARQAGISKRHVVGVEGGANVSVAVLLRLAATLDITELRVGSLTLDLSTSVASSIGDFEEAQRRIAAGLSRLDSRPREPR
jgi:transcriptional regulator with XRE-family HTH domain